MQRQRLAENVMTALPHPATSLNLGIDPVHYNQTFMAGIARQNPGENSKKPDGMVRWIRMEEAKNLGLLVK